MSEQNIYDRGDFFEQYVDLRENPANANELIEKPCLYSLLPDLNGLSILDLGCGWGEQAKYYVELGAESVLAIDISKNMINEALKRNPHENIIYKQMALEEITEISGTFDVVVSSLVFHYIEDLDGLLKNINGLLKKGGVLLFSQEHPINTCFQGKDRWTRDSEGNVLHSNLTFYNREEKKQVLWFDHSVITYHRKISTLTNNLIERGFSIENLQEPLPSKEIMDRYPEYQKDIHKPDFLIVKSTKRKDS